MPPDELSLHHLEPEEVDELPASLKARFGGGVRSDREWVLLATSNHAFAALADRMVRICFARMPELTKALSDVRIERLMDVLATTAPLSVIEGDLEIDNAQLRASYLREVRTLTAAEVRAASDLRPKNKSEPASRWKREGRIFAVRRQGIDHFPAFQFRDGMPLPAVKEILAALPPAMTPWQTALWFASENGWLDGSQPQQRLDDRDRVIRAARQLAELALG